MRLLGIDLETTGLDLLKDQIVRIGLIIAEAGSSVPLKEWDMVLWDESYPETMPIEAFEVHGIAMNHCKEFGIHPKHAFQAIEQIVQKHGVSYFVGHNAVAFDRPFLLQKAGLFSFETCFESLPWIDTRTDIDYPAKISHRNLGSLAYEHKIFNPHAHNALADVRTMLSILEQYPIEKVIERSRSPMIYVKAEVSREDRDLAKKRKYFWESCDGMTFSKCWVKGIKECELQKETEEAGFKISLLET